MLLRQRMAARKTRAIDETDSVADQIARVLHASTYDTVGSRHLDAGNEMLGSDCQGGVVVMYTLGQRPPHPFH